MDEARARALVAGERRRIEAALAGLAGEQADEDASHLDQAGESSEAGTEVQHEMVDDALTATLRNELAAVARAETRIADGTSTPCQKKWLGSKLIPTFGPTAARSFSIVSTL